MWYVGIQGISAQVRGQSAIDPCYTVTPHKSAQHICALCYMWNLCGIVVFHGSMINWEGMGSVYHETDLVSWSSMDVCSIGGGCGVNLSWNLFGVVVLHGSIVNWMRGQGSVMKIIWCNGLPVIHAQLTGRGGHLPSVYMCILLYVKLVWYNHLVCTYGQLTGGPSASSIDVHSPICETSLV